MKTMKVAVMAVAVVGTVLVLQGCYEERQVVMMQGELIPMTQQDVVDMVKGGAPNSEIIREIRESGTVFRLSANEVENLKNEGVPEEVVDYMLSTREVPPAIVERPVVVRRRPAVVYDPWWAWDYAYWPGYYYYPSRVGLSFSYRHFGGHRRYYGYGAHYRRWR
ncbi:hypothetical protein HQ563_11345 [bacterium]|nr:hypothetical protein [bacterium]